MPCMLSTIICGSQSVWRINRQDLTVQQCLPLTTPPQVCVRHALWRGWSSTGSPCPARFFCQVSQLFDPKTLTILFWHYFIRWCERLHFSTKGWILYLNIIKISLFYFVHTLLDLFRCNRGFFLYMLPWSLFYFIYFLSYTAEFSASLATLLSSPLSAQD